MMFDLVLKKGLQSIYKKNNKVAVVSVKKSELNKILYVYRNSSLFKYEQCLDIIGKDNLLDRGYKTKRFELLYVLLNVVGNERLMVRVLLNESEGVHSAMNVYGSCGWLERECLDMFGIYFYNHKDLRKILTDYGFKGYPLRKDYPLTGYQEVRYDEEFKLVLMEPLSVSQEYRYFNFQKTWS